ncbi:hypothetical protein Y032_0002g951 [Ancylostoma ceylanicum]|uniref:UDP-glucuronosyltransferase n=1 Tax=Ancylostoma ceylanicum TaxID=53326 RepID=A0A016W350_9BILA|nr:hypothetical protein Y032_0002g951 [Ancylostoma ceylanicum]
MAQNMTKSFTCQCERVFTDEALMKQLEKEKFDVGIAEAFNICGLGVFELAKIPASIATFSGVHMDSVAEAIGEPITPSYVPGAMSVAGDRMNIVDRLKNVLDVVFGRKFFINIFDSEVEAFRKKFGPEFKGYEQLIAESSYVLTNSNPYLDYPRPMLHKTVPIGGVAVSIDPKKNKLSAEWDAVLNQRNTTVLVSFGSVAKAIYMPDEYKNTLLKVFESMPDTTFIMKYEEEGSKMADHLPNVHLSTWFPQNALLADPRITAFVTHGGLGSTTELAHQGKPAILIPIFADQPRNAHMLAKHGGGIVLTKFDLESPTKLRDSLLTIFNDASYARNAKRLSEMLLNQPISAKQLLIRHSEFAAKWVFILCTVLSGLAKLTFSLSEWSFCRASEERFLLSTLRRSYSSDKPSLAAHLIEGSARSEPSVASPGAEANSTVLETQAGKVARLNRSRTSLGAEQKRDDFLKTQTTRDARSARATISPGARGKTPSLQENLQKIRSSIRGTPPVGTTFKVREVERPILYTREHL